METPDMLDKVEDRLSALPDDLLHAVLSRLKARQAVQTCVLSTRWTHLWRSVPRLDIDQREFRPAGENYSIRELQRFKNFTHILLRCHDLAHLEDFRLDVSYDMRKHADSWVRRGIGQDEIWPCRLKRLHLYNVILGDYFGRHVRFRCPSLQEMELTNCTYLLSEATVITPSSLKKLVVNKYPYGTFGLILEAPALASLCLVGDTDCIVEYEMPHSLPSLVNASIYKPVIDELNDDTDIFLCEDTTGNQMHLLRMLVNVTSLELSGFGVVHDDCLGLNFPQFTNLRTLTLDQCDLCDNFLLLKHFLRNSPNLTNLILCCCKLSDPEPREEVMKSIASYPQDLGDVIYENLRLTEIIYRVDDVQLLVEFLLGLSRNLPNNKVHDDCLGLNFPQFTNLRTLTLDQCDLCDNFLLLRHFLRNSPNLMNLILCCCKLSDPKPREEVTKNIASYPQDLGDVIYENLRLTEIIYQVDDVNLLVEFLLGLSRNLPNNKVELTGVDY